MSLEEEQQAPSPRGEMIRFLVLVVFLLATVLVVAAARPLIFGQIIPAVMGWQGEEEPAVSEPSPTPEPVTTTPTAVVTEPAGEREQDPFTPTPSPPPTLTPEVYSVQPGDNLIGIARRHGVSVEALVEANRLANPDEIRVGDRLIIP